MLSVCQENIFQSEGGLQLQQDRWGKNEKEMFGLLVGG